MIKILHIIPSLRKGGAERLVLDICTELSQRKDVDVRLVCFSDENEYPEYKGLIKSFVIPSRVELSILRKNKLFVDELQEFINIFKPDVIHTHLFEADIVSRSIYYPRAKWFSHCHDNMFQFRNLDMGLFFSKARLTNYFEKRYLFNRYFKNGGAHFIANSRSTEAYFNKIARHYQVTHLSNAINYERFFKQTQQAFPNNVLRLVNIGSFVKNKNQSFLIDVAYFLKKQNINFELHFAGDGPELNSVKQRTENLGFSENIFFHGKIEKAEKLLWSSHIYIHSAFSEAFGLTLLEAMAAGLPVVTLDGKGNRDIMIYAKNGFLIKEQDPGLFADKILEIWEDKDKYKAMSAFGQEFAEKYDIKLYVDKLLEIYSAKA